ncbi:MAG: serine/threonine-protein kinase [Myxococcota bacterium]
MATKSLARVDRNEANLPSASRYRPLARIAAGGMGVVYLSVSRDDSAFEQMLAIKVIHEALAEQAMFVSMLLAEAELTEKINHPNVVGIFDVGQMADGRHFVAMPYIEGGTLSELLRGRIGTLPVGLTVRIMIDTLRGLHAAHTAVDDDGKQLGLIHRDISPGNILIGSDGIARLIDFGVAKASTRESHTSPGTVKGKFAYMAPEQASGEPMDHRADLFAAGVVLWTCLTGRSLFIGDNAAQTLRNVLTAKIMPPSSVRPDLPPIFDKICMRALERNPKRRFQSAEEMADALFQAVRQRGAMVTVRDVSNEVKEVFRHRIARRRKFIDKLREDSKQAVDPSLFKPEITNLDGTGPSLVTPSHAMNTKPTLCLTPSPIPERLPLGSDTSTDYDQIYVEQALSTVALPQVSTMLAHRAKHLRDYYLGLAVASLTAAVTTAALFLAV